MASRALAQLICLCGTLLYNSRVERCQIAFALICQSRNGVVCRAHTGEKIWRMPMEDSYWEQMKSPIADMKNTGGRMGGAITAALFLREFVNIDKVRALLLDLVPPQSPQSHRVQEPGTCTVLLLWLWLYFSVCREDHFGARFELLSAVLCCLSAAALPQRDMCTYKPQKIQGSRCISMSHNHWKCRALHSAIQWSLP